MLVEHTDTTKTGTAALSVHGLGKRFGDRMAFDNVTFDIGYGRRRRRPSTA